MAPVDQKNPRKINLGKFSGKSRSMHLLVSASRSSWFFFSLAVCALALFSLGCSNSGGDGSSENTKGSKSDATAPDGSVKKANTSSKSTGVAGNNDAANSGSDAEPKFTPKPKKIVVSTEPDINEPEFHEVLIAATEEYLFYGMVNSIVLPAPVDCRPPESSDPKPFMSESEHESSHGKKLYFLFAKEIGDYVSPKLEPAPVGQVVVKESWTSSPSNPAARNLVNHASGNRVSPRTKVGDEMLEIGQRQNFFIMTKLATDTPKTDQGWVYGVVDADTRKVVASGKVASCMSCHVEAKNDRLFGARQIRFEETVTKVEAPKTESADNEPAKKPAEMEKPKKGSPKK